MSEKNGKNIMYQVSTLQALLLGYSKSVVTVGEMLSRGDIGLGTFENVDGEMIVLDSKAYQAKNDGTVIEADAALGVPFAAVGRMQNERNAELSDIGGFSRLEEQLMLKIEEGFGLNSVHFVRIDGIFDRVRVRSGKGKGLQHIDLKEVLSETQREFEYTNEKGTLVGLYCPDFLGSVNASGWHFHFLSEDRTKGGHVFDVSFGSAQAKINKIASIEIELPKDKAFDTYTLTSISKKDIAEVE